MLNCVRPRLRPVACATIGKHFVRRTRHYFRNMDYPNLHPPEHTRGMTLLDRDQFRKRVQIPMLSVSDGDLNSVLPHIKKLLFKMERLKPVRRSENLNEHKKILLHPLGVQGWHDLPEDVRNLGLAHSQFAWEELELCYENWKADEILRAVLPVDQESCNSYSIIGHIVHLNLREHLTPYKQLIGEVLKDKVANCRTVVNKCQTIENTYRNFQMELLCGAPEYNVEVKENGVVFAFDFSTVYWNPRLATEHERIVKLLCPGDVLYDVFAGVGPFSVPAGKKKCTVHANDLNPESFRWLQHNAKKNKVLSALSTHNKDGRDFIVQDIKTDLLKLWLNGANAKSSFKIHITMNLPAMAVEFLSAFRGLFINEPTAKTVDAASRLYPLVHVYCFAKGGIDLPNVARTLVEDNLALKLTTNLEGVHFVRNVAPNKDMYRVSFYLTDEILFTQPEAVVKRQASPVSFEPATKKLCN